MEGARKIKNVRLKRETREEGKGRKSDLVVGGSQSQGHFAMLQNATFH